MTHKKQQEVFNSIISILKDLNKKYPNQNILRHISDATAEYPNLWAIDNKEFLYTLEKYKETMYEPSQDELSTIINEGKKLNIKPINSVNEEGLFEAEGLFPEEMEGDF